MQSLPGNVFHIWVVEVVSDQRKSNVFHMDADLMGTSGAETKRDQAVAVFLFKKLIVCYSCFTVIKVYGPLDDRTVLAAERSGDDTGFRSQMPAYDCPVFPGESLFWHSWRIKWQR